jgi:hypothetical protein
VLSRTACNMKQSIVVSSTIAWLIAVAFFTRNA